MQQDFEEERARIVKLVPQEIRAQVSDRLDKHFANVARDMMTMHDTLETVSRQLETANAELADIKTTSHSVETKVDATHAAVTAENERLSGLLSQQKKRANDLITAVHDFDKRHLDCVNCERIKGKGKDDLAAFHASVVEQLATLAGSDKT
jgi:predicted  nucleic acid-binding Zn-ribbon protein